MTGYLVKRADAADLPEVLAVLNEVAAWLWSRGLDQWNRGFGPDRIGPQVESGGTFLVTPAGGGPAVATIYASPDPDPDFWTPAEQAVPAWYIAKMAVRRSAAGTGLGALMLRWVLDQAAASGIGLARLDVWRTNTGLQDWYRRQGWAHLRTVEAEGRWSGALFERPTGPDPAAVEAFTGRDLDLIRATRPPFAPGDRVITVTGQPGTVEVAMPPHTSHDVTAPASAYPMWVYWVHLDSGSTVTCGAAGLDPAAPSVASAEAATEPAS